MTTNLDNIDLTTRRSSVTPVTIPYYDTNHVPVNRGEKLEKFNELNFKRWQHNILVYLTTLNLIRFLTEDPPTMNYDEQDRQIITVVETWKNLNYLY